MTTQKPESDIVQRLRVMHHAVFEYEKMSVDGTVEAHWVKTPLAQAAADEIERLRADVETSYEANREMAAGLERFAGDLRDVVDAYQTFVDAHGPLTDFATNAEMVDFMLACESVAAVVSLLESEET